MSLKPVFNFSSSSLFSNAHRTVPSLRLRSKAQGLHISSPHHAVSLPITATGPPPPVPVPANSERKDRKVQAALTQRNRNLLNDVTKLITQEKSKDGLKKRFWKDVSVRTDSGMAFDGILRYHHSALVFVRLLGTKKLEFP